MAKHLIFKILDEITGKENEQNCYISVPERIYEELRLSPSSALLTKSLLSLNLIELFAQYSSGKLHKKGTHKRFDRFLLAYSSIDSDSRNLLYHFRNAVIHNGGSYASDKAGRIYRFTLSDSDQLIAKKSKVNYSIGITRLESELEDILENFANAALGNLNLQERIKTVHLRVGRTY